MTNTVDTTGRISAADPRMQSPLLRRLATRALGMTGADIERIVREARQAARRQQRPMTFADVEARIRGQREALPYDKRWRYAVHEAGHAVVHHFLNVGEIINLTIDSRQGGHNELTFRAKADDTLGLYESILAMLLAGRAAEQRVIGSISSGSGGSPDSDLGRATALATSLETTLGFSDVMPLLYRDYKDTRAIVFSDKALAARIHVRLEAGLALAQATLETNSDAFGRLASALFDRQIIDGDTAVAILRSKD
jgi:ATP-dependent Zn protease